jgi:hypothetical protein
VDPAHPARAPRSTATAQRCQTCCSAATRARDAHLPGPSGRGAPRGAAACALRCLRARTPAPLVSSGVRRGQQRRAAPRCAARYARPRRTPARPVRARRADARRRVEERARRFGVYWPINSPTSDLCIGGL